MKILYAEDEKELSAAVAEVLRLEGYDVICAYNGEQALIQLENEIFDLVILDIMMPEVSGTEVLKFMRIRNDFTPVLMLTAKNESGDKSEGLMTGADDYLGKPFIMKELLARISSILRRNNEYAHKKADYKNVSLNCDTNELISDNGTLCVSTKEAALMFLFLKHPGCTVSSDKISNIVGGEDKIFLFISYLRNKLKQIGGAVTICEAADGYCLTEA